MGCGPSKEATSVVPPSSAPPVSASNNNNYAKSSAVVQTKPSAQDTTPTSGPPSDTGSNSTPGGGSGSAPNSMMITTLNDVVPVEGQPNARGRFLSYASGASTPNTSSGNLSWDGNSDKETNSDKEQADRKKKLLKHSSSAIGLDEIQKDTTGLSSKVVHIEVPFGKPIEEVYDGVHNGPVLGSGVSGLVRLVTHKATGVQYAVKCLDLGLVGTKEGLAQLREEIFIMCQLDHPNIVRLEEVYESHSEIYLVQELCLGGELFDRLDEQPDYHYTESECARLVKQMLSAVRYLHSKGIIHRDLKLENFLFSSKATDSELKMIDFGLSKHFRFGEVHHEAVGTPYTVAPEVIHGSYDERCDIWAIGVISFLLLSGDPPFGGCGGPEPLLTVRANILSGKYSFEPEEIWSLVSTNAKDFVKALLVVDPQKRPTAREAQKHSWLREWASRHGKGTDNVLSANVVKALVNFKEFSDMRKLLSEVLSFTLLPDQIKELRKEFEKMDTDGSGEISLSALKEVLMTNAGAGSLGALKEDEVEDIFNAMRVNKTEKRIHWHEFIAAGLSQCQVDDRNLRLAFDRLDSDHKGYITLDDIMNLVGSDELHSEEQLREMWKDSMRSVNCTQAHITYDNFLLLMKGQTREPDMLTPKRATMNLGSVPEGETPSMDEPEHVVIIPEHRLSASLRLDDVLEGQVALEHKHDDEVSLHSEPNLGQTVYESSNSDVGSPGLDSPTTSKLVSDIAASNAGKLLAKPDKIQRKRSRTLGDETDNLEEHSAEFAPVFKADARRALALPETTKKNDMVDELNKSALVVNRNLYRAHRQMRISVMEACRRFEEQETRRARDTLIAQKAKEDGMMGLGQAGLVMRHGTKVHVTSEAIRSYLDESRAEQQQLVEKANKRGGRGRSNRKKTISDMSAMMNPGNSMGQEELGTIAAFASKTPDATKRMLASSIASINVPDLKKPDDNPSQLKPRIEPVEAQMRALEAQMRAQQEGPSVAVFDKTLRKATVPGQFHKTQDPFSADGMYGGARISAVNVNQISASERKEY